MKVICSHHDICQKCAHSKPHEHGEGCCEEPCEPYPTCRCLPEHAIEVKQEKLA